MKVDRQGLERGMFGLDCVAVRLQQLFERGTGARACLNNDPMDGALAVCTAQDLIELGASLRRGRHRGRDKAQREPHDGSELTGEQIHGGP